MATPDRRAFLQTCIHASILPWLVAPSLQASPRIVMIALGGGVRTQDFFGNTKVAPNVASLMAEGSFAKSCRVPSADSNLALRSLLSGRFDKDAAKAATTRRNPDPTLVHGARTGSLGAGSTWCIGSGTGMVERIALTEHKEHLGAPLPLTLEPSLLPFKTLRKLVSDLELSTPGAASAQPRLQLIEKLLAARKDATAQAPSPRAILALQHWILSTVNKEPLSGVGSSDELALLAAQSLILGAAPQLTVVLLRDAAVGRRSFKDYLSVLSRLDSCIGQLWKTIQGSESARATTSLMIVPSHGRNRKLSGKSLLDDDQSTSVTRVGLLGVGPAFARKQNVRGAVSSLGVAPTIAHILGRKVPGLSGRVIKSLLA